MKKINIIEWEKLCDELAERHKGKKYTGVYGVPRGGVPAAVNVAYKLELVLCDVPLPGCLVVDDLVDSGRTKEKFKDYEFDALIIKKDNEWIEFWYEDTEKDKTDLIARVLETIGENPKRPGLEETPERVIKMWKEIFRGYDKEQKPNLTVFNNGDDGILYDQMICDKGNFYSYCEHHMVPFFGEYYFAYIPDKKILGLSKVARLVDFYSAKLQVQERLVKEIVDEIEKVLQPKGIALVMKGEHLCKTMRGVKKKGEMITSVMRGVFKNNSDARTEFLRLIK